MQPAAPRGERVCGVLTRQQRDISWLLVLLLESCQPPWVAVNRLSALHLIGGMLENGHGLSFRVYVGVP